MRRGTQHIRRKPRTSRPRPAPVRDESPAFKIAKQACGQGGIGVGAVGSKVIVVVGARPEIGGIRVAGHFDIGCFSPAVAEAVAKRFMGDFVALNAHAQELGERAKPEDMFQPDRVLEISHEYEMAARRVAHRRMGRRFV